MIFSVRHLLTMAILPIVLLLMYIYQKDKRQPEPMGQLIKAFCFGVLSVPLSFTMSIPFETIGLYSDSSTTVLGNIATAFFGAAIPEEIAKFVMLWLVLRHNKYFDERMDGMVYAAFVSMGFAGVENVLYLFNNYDDYMSVAISRGLFAVPGHFCFAILMGYYYSLVKFSPSPSCKHKVLVLLAPILAHGIYDAILFVTSITSTLLSLILIVAFLVFCTRMWKYANKRIDEHLRNDMEEGRV